jgi:hypothetical protein
LLSECHKFNKTLLPSSQVGSFRRNGEKNLLRSILIARRPAAFKSSEKTLQRVLCGSVQTAAYNSTTLPQIFAAEGAAMECNWKLEFVISAWSLFIVI